MVSARTVYTIEEFTPAWKAHTKKAGLRYAFYPVSGCMLIAFSIAAYQVYRSLLLMAWVVFLGILLLLRPFWLQVLFNRNLRKNSVYGTGIVWEIEDHELRGKGEGFQFAQQWHLFEEIHQAGNGLLLYPHKRMFFWIPQKGFSSGEDYEKVCTLVREKTKKFTHQ